jgi:ankyrin repeat protein
VFEQAFDGYHSVCTRVLEKFPNFTQVKGNRGDNMLIHHAAYKHAAMPIGEDGNVIEGECFGSKSFEMILKAHPGAATELDSMGATPLHWATRNRKMTASVLQTIIRANPKGPMTKDNSGYLPLHWAVCQDTPNIEVVKNLIAAYKKGLKIRCADDTLPIHWCVNRDKPHIEVAKSLLMQNQVLLLMVAVMVLPHYISVWAGRIHVYRQHNCSLRKEARKYESEQSD